MQRPPNADSGSSSSSGRRACTRARQQARARVAALYLLRSRTEAANEPTRTRAPPPLHHCPRWVALRNGSRGGAKLADSVAVIGGRSRTANGPWGCASGSFMVGVTALLRSLRSAARRGRYGSRSADHHRPATEPCVLAPLHSYTVRARPDSVHHVASASVRCA